MAKRSPGGIVGLFGVLAGVGVATLSGGCGTNSGTGGGAGGSTGAGGSNAGDATSPETGVDAECPVVVKDADCDATRRPIVFVHGTYGSGDNFAHVAALLGSNGFCQDRIVAVEYDSIFVDNPGARCTAPNSPSGCGKIDAAIDAVLTAHPGTTQVDLMGHSQGTAHCAAYLQDATHRAKVAHYVNFSGSPDVGDVPTLSLSSMHDLNGMPHHAAGTQVTTVTFDDEDHFAVAASTQSFVEVYKYLTGNDPRYTEVQCGEDPVTIEGISETFADNAPLAGKIEVRELGGAPRSAGAAVDVLMPDAAGHFGPTQKKRNVAYEFAGFDTAGKLIGYQYFTPFKRSNRLVRFLSPAGSSDGTPVGGLVAGLTTDHIVRSPNHVAVVARWAGGAFRQDLGASLKVDGQEILTDENTGSGALATTNLSGGAVALFFFDSNANGQTDLGLPYSASFLAFTDVFIPATTAKFVELTFTPGSEESGTVAEKLTIQNWPSSEGLVSVMFH
jgi:pimeloyl-ACP methyl ester carboxylesterase